MGKAGKKREAGQLLKPIRDPVLLQKAQDEDRQRGLDGVSIAQGVGSLLWLRCELETRRVSEGRSIISVRPPRSRVGLPTNDRHGQKRLPTL